MNRKKRDKIIIGMVALVIVILGSSIIKYSIEKNSSPRIKQLKRDEFFMNEYEEKSQESENQAQTVEGIKIPKESVTGPSSITVDIEGAVKNPGVYTLKEGERVNSLVDAAGGFQSGAYVKGINRAQKLQDEGYYYVPFEDDIDKEEECVIEISNNTAGDTRKNKIDINGAKIEELTQIPGIGEVRAGYIIEYREKNGGFKSLQEIKNISGIGDKTYDKLVDYIDIR